MAEPTKSGTFPGEGNVQIHWQCWLPEAKPRAIVVIAHGVSEHADRYSHVGRAGSSGEGYAVYALDHRGHGRSGGKRAVVDRLARAVADVDTLIGMARAEQPGVRLFLLGHSMGGAISLEYALEHQDRIDGLVLSGARGGARGREPAGAAPRGGCCRPSLRTPASFRWTPRP